MSLNKWNLGDGLTCSETGSYACTNYQFLCGSISKFHTERLEAATRDINAMLEEVVKDDKDRPPGADLSILETPDGPFLAWTRSSDEGVAIDNADEIRKVLGTYDCSSQQN